MHVRTFIPHPSVSNYIHEIVVVESHALQKDITVPLIAKGYPSICFLSTGIRLQTHTITTIDKMILYGQNVEPFNVPAAGHFTIIAYFIYPHLLKCFFGFNAKEMKDTSVDMELMQPVQTKEIKEQIINATAIGERLRLMDRYIGQLAASAAETNRPIVFATNEIYKHKGLLPLKQLQSDLSMTERTFQRLFESYIGVSPKVFSKICQFNAAFRQFNGKQYNRLIEVAYDNGYADQSHFIRVFKEFTYYTPIEYLNNLPDTPS